jgi:CO/xanthine dehydrogenase Mo-binding subunit
VRKQDFLAVLATTEWGAIKAMRALRVDWGEGPPLPDPATIFDHWRTRPVAKSEVTQTVGDAAGALAGAARRITARYDFAVQTHASLGPSCAVADFRDGQLTVWSASQATHSLVDEIAPIVGLARDRIRISTSTAPDATAATATRTRRPMPR